LKKAGIELLKHIGNSPNMNAIEGTWMLIRIAVTKDWGNPHTIKWTERVWRGEWDRIPQAKIRALVVRMAAINTLIIECKGGNEFHR
jgi:hypothetical protein